MPRPTETLAAPLCPCCCKPMRDNPAHNALSRYRDVYICSACGVQEALSGDFWAALYETEKRAINIQDNAWREAWRLEELARKDG